MVLIFHSFCPSCGFPHLNTRYLILNTSLSQKGTNTMKFSTAAVNHSQVLKENATLTVAFNTTQAESTVTEKRK